MVILLKMIFKKLTSLLENSKEARNRYIQLTLQESLLHWETASIEDKTESIRTSQNASFFPWFYRLQLRLLLSLECGGSTLTVKADFSGSTQVVEQGASLAEQSLASSTPISPKANLN